MSPTLPPDDSINKLLQNIFRDLDHDISVRIPSDGDNRESLDLKKREKEELQSKKWEEEHEEERSRSELEKNKQDSKEQINWAWFAKIYTSVATSFIFLTVFLCLIGKVKIHFQWGQFLSELSIGNFHLSDNVLIAFITTTFVSVLGLCFIVLEYYFKKQNKR